MASIDCVVDTHPMANEMSSVSRSVATTTTAVVAMRAAVVSAEKEAADLVCHNVNRGFYALIRSQISQKIAKLQSEVDSHLMQLNQQRKQLLAIKGRMERDYNMISARYTKLFTGINGNLRQRVYELDKHTMNFATKDVARIANRTRLLPATVPVTQSEALAASQRILASNLKFLGMRAIDTMGSFLEDMAAQKRLTDRIMLRERIAPTEQQITIPVAICECNYDAMSTSVNLSMAKGELSQSVRNTVMTRVGGAVAEMAWHPATSNREVESDFARRLNDSSLSDRAKEWARKLYDANNYMTI